MISTKVIIGILISYLILTGCAGVQTVDPRVSIIDNFLAADISINKVLSRINSSGFMEIQINGVNKTLFYKKLEYKIEWFDQNGFLIHTILSQWTEFPVFENAEFSFKAVAPKTTATDFKILIRKGN